MWRRNFRLLWLGQAVNDLGSAVTGLALPLVAAVTLQASTFEVGVLAALGTAGWALVSLPAGVLVDRVPRKALMVWCDVGRLAVVLAIPGLAITDQLTIEGLWVAAALLSVLTVVFEIAHWSLVAEVTPRAELVGAHSAIATVHGVGMVAGPALAGGMAAALGTVRVLLVDALSFVVSIGCLLAMRTAPAPRPEPRKAMLREMREGFSFVAGDPLLRRIVAFGALNALCDAMTGALLVVFLLRDLSATPAVIGMVAAAGAAGGTLGATVAPALSRRIGSARLLWLAPSACGSLALLVPLTPPGHPAIAALGVFGPAFGMVMFHVLQISYRQAACPVRLQGRMNATVRWILRSGRPLGALLGGALGSTIGLRPALVAAAIGSWLAALLLVASPLAALRDLPAVARQS
jgi:MFS family permease